MAAAGVNSTELHLRAVNFIESGPGLVGISPAVSGASFSDRKLQLHYEDLVKVVH